jgi:hypothetical protein
MFKQNIFVVLLEAEDKKIKNTVVDKLLCVCVCVCVCVCAALTLTPVKPIFNVDTTTEPP